MCESTKVPKGPLLILDINVNNKKFKHNNTRGNCGQPFKLQESRDKR